MNQRVIGPVHAPRELRADEMVRNIRGGFQIRKAVEEVQREEEVCRHSIAMRFNVNLDVSLVGKPAPPLRERNAVLDPSRPNIRLKVYMFSTETRYQFQHGF